MQEAGPQLAKCPACGHEISDGAAKCPQCGHALTAMNPRFRRDGAIPLMALGFLLVFWGMLLSNPHAHILKQLWFWGFVIMAIGYHILRRKH